MKKIALISTISSGISPGSSGTSKEDQSQIVPPAIWDRWYYLAQIRNHKTIIRSDQRKYIWNKRSSDLSMSATFSVIVEGYGFLHHHCEPP
jgi:hypothetical protein